VRLGISRVPNVVTELRHWSTVDKCVLAGGSAERLTTPQGSDPCKCDETNVRSIEPATLFLPHVEWLRKLVLPDLHRLHARDIQQTKNVNQNPFGAVPLTNTQTANIAYRPYLLVLGTGFTSAPPIAPLTNLEHGRNMHGASRTT
jgi:hypothetical protein